jgi:hypothetical protein
LPAITSAGLYRKIESCQGIFKYNGTRMTLVDPKSRPFQNMQRDEIIAFLSSIITMVGAQVVDVIQPGFEGAKSSKFPTFMVGDGGERTVPIVFGFAHSSAEEMQISEIGRSLTRWSHQLGGQVRVWDGNRAVEVDRVIRRGGSREKTDAVLCLGSDERIRISLKRLKGNRPTQMQGWSGLVGLHGNPEFLSFTQQIWDEQLTHGKLTSRCWRRIEDAQLRHDACWGKGDDRVDIIAAGERLCFVQSSDGALHLDTGTGGGVWYHSTGAVPDGDFEPVFFCRPGSQHRLITPCGIIKGARAMIAPIAVARAGKKVIEI